jgi:hypothetical protein
MAPEDFSATWSEAATLPLDQIERVFEWFAEPR